MKLIGLFTNMSILLISADVAYYSTDINNIGQDFKKITDVVMLKIWSILAYTDINISASLIICNH